MAYLKENLLFMYRASDYKRTRTYVQHHERFDIVERRFHLTHSMPLRVNPERSRRVDMIRQLVWSIPSSIFSVSNRREPFSKQRIRRWIAPGE